MPTPARRRPAGCGQIMQATRSNSKQNRLPQEKHPRLLPPVVTPDTCSKQASRCWQVALLYSTDLHIINHGQQHLQKYAGTKAPTPPGGCAGVSLMQPASYTHWHLQTHQSPDIPALPSRQPTLQYPTCKQQSSWKSGCWQAAGVCTAGVCAAGEDAGGSIAQPQQRTQPRPSYSNRAASSWLTAPLPSCLSATHNQRASTCCRPALPQRT